MSEGSRTRTLTSKILSLWARASMHKAQVQSSFQKNKTKPKYMYSVCVYIFFHCLLWKTNDLVLGFRDSFEDPYESGLSILISLPLNSSTLQLERNLPLINHSLEQLLCQPEGLLSLTYHHIWSCQHNPVEREEVIVRPLISEFWRDNMSGQ
jgi:hypothetical protein